MASNFVKLELLFDTSRRSIIKEQASIKTGMFNILDILSRSTISEEIFDMFPVKKEDDLKVLELKLKDQKYYTNIVSLSSIILTQNINYVIVLLQENIVSNLSGPKDFRRFFADDVAKYLNINLNIMKIVQKSFDDSNFVTNFKMFLQKARKRINNNKKYEMRK